jgi:hypothetical protein
MESNALVLESNTLVLESKAEALVLESKALVLESNTLVLESKASALGVFWIPFPKLKHSKLKFFEEKHRLQSFSFGFQKTLKFMFLASVVMKISFEGLARATKHCLYQQWH